MDKKKEVVLRVKVGDMLYGVYEKPKLKQKRKARTGKIVGVWKSG